MTYVYNVSRIIEYLSIRIINCIRCSFNFFSNYKCRMYGTPTPICRQKRNHLHLLSGKHRHHFLKQSYISSSSRRICAKDRRLCTCYVHRASDADQRSLRVKPNALPPPWRYFSVCLTKLLCGNWQIPQLFCNFFCFLLLFIFVVLFWCGVVTIPRNRLHFFRTR